MNKRFWVWSSLFTLVLVVTASCARAQSDDPTSTPSESRGQPLADPVPEGMEVATFAGGCFWCVESAFDDAPGVVAAISGYSGGDEDEPTYGLVSMGVTGHTEAVRVIYDPAQTTYEQLLYIFWRVIDPTDEDGQFADQGSQYRPVIFVHNEAQRQAAIASRDAIAASGVFDDEIVVPIEDAAPFYVAEEYHQNYHVTHAERYEQYRSGSGRTGFLEAHWGDQASH